MSDLNDRLKLVVERLNVPKLLVEIGEIEKASEEADFWQEHTTASSKMKQLADKQKKIEQIEWLQMLLESGETKDLEKELTKIEKILYLSGEYDEFDAIVSIHSGQGGTEAMDWADMLFRMYTRYFERKKWKYTVVESRAGEQAGIKSATLRVEGTYVYGHMAAERGTHRLVRQSPFNADKLRQTSFALVEVLPIIVGDTDIVVKDEDISWDFYRASGAGGQNVNKVSTAVRLTHAPSGIVVTSQTQRSQHQNRETAMELLKSKLWEKQQLEEKENVAQMKGGYSKPGWGNQIRSYVLHPYKMVKDLRTEYETSQVDKVLDGELDGFVESYLKKEK